MSPDAEVYPPGMAPDPVAQFGMPMFPTRPDADDICRLLGELL